MWHHQQPRDPNPSHTPVKQMPLCPHLYMNRPFPLGPLPSVQKCVAASMGHPRRHVSSFTGQARLQSCSPPDSCKKVPTALVLDSVSLASYLQPFLPSCPPPFAARRPRRLQCCRCSGGSPSTPVATAGACITSSPSVGSVGRSAHEQAGTADTSQARLHLSTPHVHGSAALHSMKCTRPAAHVTHTASQALSQQSNTALSNPAACAHPAEQSHHQAHQIMHSSKPTVPHSDLYTALDGAGLGAASAPHLHA
jgi:hypothetical protein